MRPSALTFVLLLLSPGLAYAWGNEGHQIIATIAMDQLTPTVRAKVDAMLATDTSNLTAHDIASEATWADAYRNAGHRETAAWHFVDNEIDRAPDLMNACFGFPAPDQPPSSGPSQDCVVDKIEEFRTELLADDTAPGERLLALKYLLHFVGDIHQPLHASDNHDRGGNCVHVSLGGSRTTNLHAFWDTGVIQLMGPDAQAITARLEAQISPARRQAWTSGDAKAWALDSYQVATSVAYMLGTSPGCASDVAPITLPDGYQTKAEAAAQVQLEKAGVRLAWLLNQTLGS